MKKAMLRTVMVGFFFGLVCSSVMAEIRYTVTDLGDLSGGTMQSEAWAINNSGQVVGWSLLPDGTETHAFLYSNGIMQDLGTLGGRWAYARGINNNGQVVGYSYISGDSYEHAFLYSNGVMQDLGGFGGTNSIAFGINESSQVVGYSYSGHAFLYSGGVMQNIGNGVTPLSINASGQVVGFSSLTVGVEHACLYSDGIMHDLGTLSGMTSRANGINASGQVVGYSYLGDAYSPKHAFLYSGGAMQDLNTLLSSGFGWTLNEANAINDLGQIIGYGTNPTGQNHAFLLTPVPEPITFSLIGFGGLALLKRRRS